MKYAPGTDDDDFAQSTGNPRSSDNSDSDNDWETSFCTAFKPEAGMAIANPLYGSAYSLSSLPGASRDITATSNPLYESTVSEHRVKEIGEVNYGASDDENGDDTKDYCTER